MTVSNEGSQMDKPRVISEVKKRRRLSQFPPINDDGGPRITGELLWSATPTQWHVKLAEVRQGTLLVHCCSSGAAEFRLPLHHLNIIPAYTPRTFTLATSRGIPLATFQVQTEKEYQRWVQVLAVEILRQTPMQDVRFLDIIGITRGECIPRHGRSEESAANSSRIFLKSEVTPQEDNRGKLRDRDDLKKKRERTEFSQWLRCVKRETDEGQRIRYNDFDMKNMKIRRAQKIRAKLPFADTWNKMKGSWEGKRDLSGEELKIASRKSVSVDNLSKQQGKLISEMSSISDESGISSGDENNNTNSDYSVKGDMTKENGIYVSVKEKKKFFESLNESEEKRIEVMLGRSSSISFGQEHRLGLAKGKRASSMQNLSSNPSVPVRQIRRLFEGGSLQNLTKSMETQKNRDEVSTAENETDSKLTEDAFVHPVERKPKEEVNYANIQYSRNKVLNQKIPPRIIVEESESDQLPVHGSLVDLESHSPAGRSFVAETSLMKTNEPQTNNMSTLLIQRKLQRGERKLSKLRIQIAEVEDTIKNIAEDLKSIGIETLKRRSGLELFAALRRRLEEETSRLERLREETAKVITENQRTILKMNPTTCPNIN